MDINSGAKRRRNINRRRYCPLNDDNDSRRPAFTGQGETDVTSETDAGRDYRQFDQSVSTLCDKCWAVRTRRLATVHCDECDKNMCGQCAKYDQQRHPWWLPFCIAQCLRFMCTGMFQSHSIIELTPPLQRGPGRHSDEDIPRWAFSSEAAHVQRIPRVTRSSLRSNKSDTSKRDTPRGTDATSDKHKAGKTKRSGKSNENKPMERRSRTRSRSLDHTGERTGGAHGGRGGRRARSAERLPNKYAVVNTIGRKQLYCDNWDNEPYSFHRSRGTYVHSDVSHERPCGRTVPTSNDNKYKRGQERTFKADSNMFVGNWFDEFDPWQNHAVPRNRKQGDTYTKDTDDKAKPTVHRNISIHIEEPYNVYADRGSMSSKQTYSGPTSSTNQAYIVEEPPDLCSICLEDLSKKEARSLRCNHDFHTHCVVELLSQMDFDFGIKCPVCNQVTRVNNYYAPRNMWVNELPIATYV